VSASPRGGRRMLPAPPAADRLRHYLPLLRGRGPVLVLGGDHEELVARLAADGVEATGIGPGEGGGAAEAVLARLEVGDVPGPFGAAFCARLVEHLQPDRTLRLLSAVCRLLVPEGRLVVAIANPASYAVLAGSAWNDVALARLYDPRLLAYLCSRAGFAAAEPEANPATRPEVPAWLLGDRPVVHPELAEAIGQAVARLGLEHQEQGRPAADPHDPSFAYNLAHVLKTLADRLAETQAAARDLAASHRAIVRALHEPAELYVVASRRAEPEGSGAG
jgi:SAM-dependent methyltransferase